MDYLMIVLIPTILCIICYLVGLTFSTIFNRKLTPGGHVAIGFLVATGCFHLLALPFMYRSSSVRPLEVITIICLSAILIAGICIWVKEKPMSGWIKTDKDNVVLYIVIIAVIAYQLFQIVYYQHNFVY